MAVFLALFKGISPLLFSTFAGLNSNDDCVSTFLEADFSSYCCPERFPCETGNGISSDQAPVALPGFK